MCAAAPAEAAILASLPALSYFFTCAARNAMRQSKNAGSFSSAMVNSSIA